MTFQIDAETMKPGTCFPSSVHIAWKLRDAGLNEIVICHGLPLGTGSENLGQRYWHAWVEARRAGSPWVVYSIDADGQVKTVRRSNFYRAGRIEGDKVHRFTVEAALNEMNAREHYGPWVDNWEQYGL